MSENDELLNAVDELSKAVAFYEAPRFVVSACMENDVLAREWQASFERLRAANEVAKAALARARGES